MRSLVRRSLVARTTFVARTLVARALGACALGACALGVCALGPRHAVAEERFLPPPAKAKPAPRAALEPLSEPSVWRLAREPDARLRADTVAVAEDIFKLVHDSRRHGRELHGKLDEVARLLQSVDAARSPTPTTRLLWARVLGDLDRHGDARDVLLGLLADGPPRFLEGEIWADLGISYAKLGERGREIEAYGRALEHTSVDRGRSLLLSNRAEALMALGQVSAAVDGYREALAELSQVELMAFGSTTLWGLAVALDRNGDLEGALTHVTLARAYDPIDRRLREPTWFFSPAHDEHWYWALGHQTVARNTADARVRLDALAQAKAEYDTYLARAPADDRYRALGELRRARVDAALTEALRRFVGKRLAPEPPEPPATPSKRRP